MFGVFTNLVGCTGRQQEHPHGPLQVKIPMLTDKGYQLEVVNLLSLDDLFELKGWAARFLYSPEQTGKNLDGYQPKIRVVKNADGVYIATDELSLQLLTLYYHMENLGLMDEMAGVKDLNKWPRTVAVNVNYSSAKDNSRVENNALYSGDLDALLFVPYTQTSLPITVNAGIIAHEHFHSLFNKLVVLPLGESYPDAEVTTLHDENKMLQIFNFKPIAAIVEAEHKPLQRSESDVGELAIVRNQKIIKIRDYYHSHLLRGLNEGLADFWGWLYSGDVNFVGQSLPQFKAKRSLNTEGKLPSTECFSSSLYQAENEDSEYPGPGAKAYRYGTTVARILKQFSYDYQISRGLTRLELKSQIAPRIINSLKLLRQSFAGLESEKYLSTSEFLQVFLGQFEGLSDLESEKLKVAVATTLGKEAKKCD